MCKVLHKARLVFDLQTLRQQLLQKILDKMYSRRQKAREMLAGVALQLGCNNLDEVLRSIYG